MHLPFASGVADLIWCHHVLEQVEDDQVAMKELLRVLRAGSGELIVSVGTGTQPTTLEFGFANQALSGNRRAFGADFVQRLTKAGFNVGPVEYGLTETERVRYAVHADRFYRCTRS